MPDPLQTLDSSIEAFESELFASLKPAVVSAERAERLRKRIDALIDAEAGATTVRLEEGQWIRRSPHCEIKIVNHDRATGLYSYLLRLAANGSVEPHAHHAIEECLILSGEIVVDGMTLRAGDYQALQPGTTHARIFSPQGATLFIRSELDLAA